MEPLDLDQKLIETFPGCVVRKDLLHQIKKGTNVPSFVLEFLLAKFCATDDPDEIQAGIAAVIETGYVSLLIYLLYAPIASVLPGVLAAVILVALGLFTGPLFVWLPIYSWLGGWDPSMLVTLERAMQISGPSKPLVGFILRLARKISQYSPFM